MMRTRWLVPLGLYAGFVSAGDLSCTALIYDQVGKDLYLGDDTGAPVKRLTSDGRTKGGASLSPRADKVSFLYEKPNTEIQVVARDGNVHTVDLAKDVDHLDAPLDATQWDSEALVMVTFYGHANSLFQWVGVGKTRLPSNIPKGATDSVLRMGTGCASAPQGRHVACIAGFEISIDDGAAVFMDAFEEGRKIGTFNAAEGVKTSLPGYEGASFTITYVRPEGTSYRAGLGDFQPEIFMPDNEVGLIERIGDSAWGEFRVVSHRVGSMSDAGGATVAVRALDAEELPRLGGLAWTEDGSTLAAVWTKPGSGSELLIVRRDRGGRWLLSKRLAMTPDADGGRVKFINASTIYVRGAGAESSVFAIKGDHLEKLKSLPNYLESSGLADSRVLSIEDWSCGTR
jgi:hypothetical protein